MRGVAKIIVLLAVAAVICTIQIAVVNRADGYVLINLPLIVAVAYISQQSYATGIIIGLSSGVMTDWIFGFALPTHMVSMVLAMFAFWLLIRRVFVNETWISIVSGAVAASLVYALTIVGLGEMIDMANKITPENWSVVMWSFVWQTVTCAGVMYFINRWRRKTYTTVVRKMI